MHVFFNLDTLHFGKLEFSFWLIHVHVNISLCARVSHKHCSMDWKSSLRITCRVVVTFHTACYRYDIIKESDTPNALNADLNQSAIFGAPEKISESNQELESVCIAM